MQVLKIIRSFAYTYGQLYFASYKKIVMEYNYITRSCTDLSDSIWEQCSILFSEHYGKYSGEGREKKGQRIKMGISMYKRFYGNNPNMYVSLCYKGETLLGHAFFLRKEIEDKGWCSWVTQLVVNSQYRKRNIGSRLLQSAWGFSDYYAWGLATANAITLKTLESVTWREIQIEDMAKNMDVLEKLMDEIPFVKGDNVLLNKKQCQVFSDFYPELEVSNKEPSLQIYARKLGQIKPGYEWLAFTFASQTMTFSDEKFKKFMDFSEQQLKEAYSRMDMPVHPWTKHTEAEIDYLIEHTQISQEAKILDLGCGQGQHSLELASRGYKNLVGVDFSESNIRHARENATANSYVSFICGDARTLQLGSKYDLVLCLYDVIGSFREEKDNKNILKVIKRHLHPGGKAVVSVMNMELTEHKAKYRCSLKEYPEILLHLPPSDTMAASGNIFRPEFYLINTDDGLVYRKEQFSHDNQISAEYVVADKRYTMDEFETLVTDLGFIIEQKNYVQAGRWNVPLEATDERAKELLFILSLPQ